MCCRFLTSYILEPPNAGNVTDGERIPKVELKRLVQGCLPFVFFDRAITRGPHQRVGG